MGTHTAHILIGSSHPNDGGLSYTDSRRPELFLSENSRASWNLKTGSWRHARDARRPLARRGLICVPTANAALEVALLMVGVILCPDLLWSEQAKSFRTELSESGRFEFPDLSEETINDLLRESRSFSPAYPKIVLNVFQPDCLIARQIGALGFYQNPMSVSMPVFNRDPNRWSGGVTETGGLPDYTPEL